jgi:hypothetical protein
MPQAPQALTRPTRAPGGHRSRRPHDQLRPLLDAVTDLVVRRCVGRLDRELAVLAQAERRAARGAPLTSINTFLKARLQWWDCPRRCGECGRRTSA